MKLIIPVEFYRKGGVERVIIGLISNLIEQVDQIIFIASPKNIDYFKTILPTSEKLIYEKWQWSSSSQAAKKIAFFHKLLSFSQKLKLEGLTLFLGQKIKNLRIQSRINYLIDKYQATHCLYAIINRLEPPKVTIPLSGIAYDLFWRFAPLTYADDYRASYDRCLFLWLQKADLILAISEKTRNDILSIFGDSRFASKVKAVPLAGFSSHNTTITTEIQDSSTPIFYFPSSFGIYKDHLTLIKAGLKLAQQNLDFKIVFIGKETDNLINGTLTLSQQSKTQEYDEYLHECNEIYEQNKSLINQYFKGLGYCDYETVEYYYATCSCVVFPSQYEGFGLAISEAIVRGLPVIATDLAVFKEQVDLYQCSDRIDFYAKGDVDALADLLEGFINHPKPKFSTDEIEKRFSHWTWQTVAQEYINGLLKLDSPS